MWSPQWTVQIDVKWAVTVEYCMYSLRPLHYCCPPFILVVWGNLRISLSILSPCCLNLLSPMLVEGVLHGTTNYHLLYNITELWLDFNHFGCLYMLNLRDNWVFIIIIYLFYNLIFFVSLPIFFFTLFVLSKVYRKKKKTLVGTRNSFFVLWVFLKLEIVKNTLLNYNQGLLFLLMLVFAVFYCECLVEPLYHWCHLENAIENLSP